MKPAAMIINPFGAIAVWGVADPKACCNETVFWVRLNVPEKAITPCVASAFLSTTCWFMFNLLICADHQILSSRLQSIKQPSSLFLCSCPLPNFILILFTTFFTVGCGHFDFQHVAYWWPFPASCHPWMKEASLLFQSPGQRQRYGIGPN